MSDASKHISEEVKYHLAAIDVMRRQYEEAIRPHVQRLAYLRSIEPPAPILLSAEAYAELQSKGLAPMMYPTNG